MAVDALNARLVFDDGTVLEFEPQERRDDFQGTSCAREVIGPWTVWFRSNGTRDEVVVELGEFTSDTRAAFRSKGYVAEIFSGAQKVAEQPLPFHDWFGRWRWQSAPLPVQTLKPGDRRVLPFDWSLDNSGHSGSIGPYKGPFEDAAGITQDFRITGERNDIGIYTEWVAEYLETQKSGDLETILTQAETHAQFPIHIRQPSGSWVDLSLPANVNRSTHENEAGNPNYIAQQPVGTMFGSDTGHYPSICWVPWLLTNDVYYLEELQAAVVIHLAPMGWFRPRIGLVDTDQVRSVAWTLRDVAFAYAATPDNAVDWLLPKSFFKRCLEDQCRWMLNSGRDDPASPRGPRFHYFFPPHEDDGGHLGFWQYDMVVSVLGMLVHMGVADDVPIVRETYDWCLENTIARTAGASGWPPQFSTPYWLTDENGNRMGNTETTWPELWRTFAQANKIPLEPKGDRYMLGDDAYLSYTRGALAIAVLNGRQDLRPAFERFDKWARGRRVEAKWCFAAQG